ncbi:MAG: hypothetical protein ABIQ90_02890 [Polaromonas sp.]
MLLHLAAILVYQRRQRKLVGAMMRGDKELSVAAPHLARRLRFTRGGAVDPGRLRWRSLWVASVERQVHRSLIGWVKDV